jgi:hypothetical protein
METSRLRWNRNFHEVKSVYRSIVVITSMGTSDWQVHIDTHPDQMSRICYEMSKYGALIKGRGM